MDTKGASCYVKDAWKFLPNHPSPIDCPESGADQPRQIGKQASVETICKCWQDFGREAGWDLFLLICEASFQNGSTEEAWGWLRILHGSISGTAGRGYCGRTGSYVHWNHLRGHSSGLLSNDLCRKALPGRRPTPELYWSSSWINLWILFIYLLPSNRDVSFMRVESPFVFCPCSANA